MSIRVTMKTRFSRRQTFVLVVIASVHFFSSVCVSLQAPFYPAEAEKKGATATEYGLVFGVYELVAFLFSPVFGKIVERYGTKLLLSCGMLSSAVALIFFGLLDFIDDRTTFIVLSFILRILESLGATAAVVSAFSLTGSMFPDSVATVFATLEIFYGVGYIIGPTLGEVLFYVGGYVLPFAFVGTVTAIVGLVILLIVPDISDKSNTGNKGAGNIGQVLKIPAILIDSACIVGAASSSGFYNATLEPHIREFNLSPVCVGLIFIISGATYAIVAPIFGRIIDRYGKQSLMMAIGCLLNIISFTLVGPSPLLPMIPKSLFLTVIALIIHGFALAAINVSTFIDAIKSAILNGFPEGISTYGLLSGVWSSSFALGAFIGPSIAGYLFDNYGFQNATLFVVVVHTVLLVILVIFISRKNRTSGDGGVEFRGIKQTFSRAPSLDFRVSVSEYLQLVEDNSDSNGKCSPLYNNKIIGDKYPLQQNGYGTVTPL